MVHRLPTIYSVLKKTTNLFNFILVHPPFIVPGSKTPTQAIIDHIHGYRKACVSLQLRAGYVVECPTAGCSKLAPSCHRLSAEITLIQEQCKESWPAVLSFWGRIIVLFENFQVIPSAWIKFVFTFNLLLACIGLNCSVFITCVCFRTLDHGSITSPDRDTICSWNSIFNHLYKVSILFMNSY